jgi:membrane-bound lytic murein transglycosylase A
MHFVMLVPKSLDPVARGHKLPMPDPRPSERIARLFPQTVPAKDQKDGAAAQAAKPSEFAKTGAAASTVSQAKDATVAVANPVPLPEPRPVIKPVREPRRHVHRRYDRQ